MRTKEKGVERKIWTRTGGNESGIGEGGTKIRYGGWGDGIESGIDEVALGLKGY